MASSSKRTKVILGSFSISTALRRVRLCQLLTIAQSSCGETGLAPRQSRCPKQCGASHITNLATSSQDVKTRPSDYSHVTHSELTMEKSSRNMRKNAKRVLSLKAGRHPMLQTCLTSRLKSKVRSQDRKRARSRSSRMGVLARRICGP